MTVAGRAKIVVAVVFLIAAAVAQLYAVRRMMLEREVLRGRAAVTFKRVG